MSHIVYAAILAINITTSFGERHIRVPMPSMAYCKVALESNFWNLEMLHDDKYSEEMYCDKAKASHNKED